MLLASGLHSDSKNASSDRVDRCCLEDALKLLQGGDQTEIGEKGITLSGGQKARLALARCVYAAPKLCLLDDPLSALDASTGKRCFDALLGDRGVLRDAAGVLVTHGTHYLRRADSIIVLDVDGGVAFEGTWPEAERAAATGSSISIASSTR